MTCTQTVPGTHTVTDRSGWLGPPAAGSVEQPQPMNFKVKSIDSTDGGSGTDDGDRNVNLTRAIVGRVLIAHGA